MDPLALLTFAAGLVCGALYAVYRIESYPAGDRGDRRVSRVATTMARRTTRMSLEFTTAKKRRDPLEFTLDDEVYHFTPTKTAGVILAMADGDNTEVMRRTFDWLSNGLPDEEAQRIIDRLNDPDDDLDTEDLGDLISNLQDEVSGRPTTSPGGSKGSSTKNGRGSRGGRRPAA